MAEVAGLESSASVSGIGSSDLTSRRRFTALLLLVYWKLALRVRSDVQVDEEFENQFCFLIEEQEGPPFPKL